LKHIDLFTGIGGFSLACHWNNIETVVMCEKDKRCRQFLDRTWPGIPVIEDIKEFDGTRWTGAFILTAGVPCQPASRAGKQGGKGDDRWLWPEAIRIVDEAKPRWCLFENPPGIYDVGINGILSDLESIGYETGIVEVPACAVNSPQIRQRVWIVANAVKGGSDVEAVPVCREESGQISMLTGASQGDVANTEQGGPKTFGRAKCDKSYLYGKPTTSQQRLRNQVKATWSTPKQVDGGKNLRGAKSAENERKRGATSLVVETHGIITSGPLARTENFVERLTTLSTWLMGYTGAYLRRWETASSRRSRMK